MNRIWSLTKEKKETEKNFLKESMKWVVEAWTEF